MTGNVIHHRLEKIRAALRRRALDALLVGQPENRRYMSGFSATDTSCSESTGFLLLPSTGEPLLLTDFRFQQQATIEAPAYRVYCYPRGLPALMRQLLPKMAVRRLAFESRYLLYDTYISLRKTLNPCGVELVPLRRLVERQRRRKSREEVAGIKAAQGLNERVFEEIYQTLTPGLTERQVARGLENLMLEMGADGPAFETIVAGGPNGALPHAVPTDRPLAEGEPIVIDMGVRLHGYCSDMTRTVVLGEIPDQVRERFRIVRRAQLAGIAAVRPGVQACLVDRAARSIIEQAGYGKRFGHGLGHGVGLAVHEEPALNRRNRRQLAAGMVITVEPGIYLPGWGGIRLENMLVVGEERGETLNSNTTFLDI